MTRDEVFPGWRGLTVVWAFLKAMTPARDINAPANVNTRPPAYLVAGDRFRLGRDVEINHIKPEKISAIARGGILFSKIVWACIGSGGLR